MFDDEIKAELQKPLSPDAIASRKQGGSQVSYIEGWYAMAEANRIFGFDGWTRETVNLALACERERKIGREQKDGWSVTYTAKVRVTAHGVVREGCGAGHGIGTDLGEAHESALKEAETDATKRALMTFGWPLGMALYDKERSNVGNAPPERDPSADRFIRQLSDMIDGIATFEEAASWWNEDTQKKTRRDFGLTNDDVAPLVAKIQGKPKKKEAA